jgi:hypothetical protein
VYPLVRIGNPEVIAASLLFELPVSILQLEDHNTP